MTREVGNLNAIHIGAPNLAILAGTNAHQCQALKIFTTKSTTPNQEHTPIGKTSLKIFAENCDLVIVP